MELDQFLAAVETMSASDLRAVAASVGNDSVTDEVDWWRATIAIDRAIRHGRCSRGAPTRPPAPRHLVQHVATREDFELPDADVTKVARAAAEVARAMIAGPSAQPIANLLLEHWAPVGVLV